jgi:hypothetical protein
MEEAAPPVADASAVVSEKPVTEAHARQWRDNPFPVETVNLGGYKIVLQESRPDKEARKDKAKPAFDELWQMQIKFGSGGKDDIPPEKVLDYLKTLTKTVTTREGEEKEVRLFQWNRRDQAWGMAIEYEAARASRIKAEQIFDEVVKMMAEEHGVGRER